MSGLFCTNPHPAKGRRRQLQEAGPLARIRVMLKAPLTIVAALVCLFVFWSHRANIQRLRAGTEHRFGRPKAGEPS